MFKDIFLFELRYRLKRPATYIYFLIYSLIGLLYGAILYGSFGVEIAVQISGGGQNLLNAPSNLHNLMAGVGVLSVFAVAAFMGVPIYRDFEYKVHSLYFTKPISKFAYLGGRFAGSFLVLLFSLLGIVLGFMAALLLPNVLHEKMGDFHFYHYLHPFFISVIPFAFFSGAVFFATVSLSRNQLFIYLDAIIMLVLLTVSGTLIEQVDNKFLGSLLDPTGGVALQTTTEFWTIVEKNTLLVPLSNAIILNLLIWQGIAVAILAFTYYRFSFSYTSDSSVRIRRKPESTTKLLGDVVSTEKIHLPKVNTIFNTSKNWNLLIKLTQKEFKGVVTNIIFIAIVTVGILLLILTSLVGGQIFETPTLPVTYRVLDTVSGAFGLFLIIIIVFYSGEVVWKERSSNVNLMFDALPLPNWVTFGSKLLALFGVIYFLITVMFVSGLLIQTFQGYFNYELGLYISTLYFYRALPLLTFCSLAFFVQVMVNNKYLGFFVVILFFFFSNTFLPLLGVEDNLFQFNSSPGLFYSDMNGYGSYVYGYMSFQAYWGFLAMILLVISNIFWVRGSDNAWKSRQRNAGQNFDLTQKLLLGIGLLGFLGMGGFIYYNTHVLNTFQASKESIKQVADFEKLYKKYEKLPQPKITAVKLDVDLYPSEQAMHAKGVYTLENKTKKEIKEIHLMMLAKANDIDFKFSVAAKQKKFDKKYDYYIYTLDKPLKPKQSIKLTFDAKFASEGFNNAGVNTSIVENGTFFNNFSYFPLIGYQGLAELSQNDIRKKYNLPPRERIPAINDEKGKQRNFITGDADFIDFEATISTEDDQIAIAPGYLQKEWKKDGRKYYQYKMDSPIMNFYSILSGRFKVKKDTWKSPEGKEVSLEIYYHPSHNRNLDRMMKGMKQALSYYSKSFGPYQHRQARIIEFPRYATFAQSFPNTIPFSEGIGFIADIDDKSDIDYVFYVTAHEIAHQWWAHQVVPANTQGSSTISESMSQYGALMVMEKELGADKMKKFLRIELNNYLRGRSGEIKEESPLLLTENQQYIHYNKGSVIMYALKDYVGEERLNNAIKKYVQKVKFTGPPYTTMLDLLAAFREATPDSLQYIIKDMFETITLYDNQVKEVTYKKKGDKYLVTIEFSAKKYRADGYGKETEIPMSDYIDVGIFGKEKKDGKSVDKTLYLQKHKISDKDTKIQITVDGKPEEAGIDPYNKLIDRKPDDNLKKASEKK